MMNIGYQLSSIAAYLNNEDSIKKSFDKIARIGYTHVQLQGASAEIPDAAIKSALDLSGLKCVATQEDYILGFGDDPERAISRAVTCGAGYLAFALMPFDIDTTAKLRAFADKVIPIYDKARAAGLVFAFHPIGYDFRLIDGAPVYKLLMDMLPGDTQLTFCVIGAFDNGFSYEEILNAYKGRVDLVHFKDAIALPGGEKQMMPLGQGEHDWQPVWKACERADVKWVFAEQEKWNKDAFECAADSYRYLTGIMG